MDAVKFFGWGYSLETEIMRPMFTQGIPKITKHGSAESCFACFIFHINWHKIVIPSFPLRRHLLQHHFRCHAPADIAVANEEHLYHIISQPSKRSSINSFRLFS